MIRKKLAIALLLNILSATALVAWPIMPWDKEFDREWLAKQLSEDPGLATRTDENGENWLFFFLGSSPDESKKTARADCVNLLLERGAQINQLSLKGLTPLDVAMGKGFLPMGGAEDLVDALKAKGARSWRREASGGNTILGIPVIQAGTGIFKQAQDGDLTALKTSLSTDPKQADAVSGDMLSPIYYGIFGKQRNVVQFLLDRGAQIDGPASAPMTPLQAAVTVGDPEMIRLLLDRGADVRYRWNHGNTVLHDAARAGFSDIIQLFLKKGCSPAWRNDIGEAPLTQAVKCGYSYGVLMFDSSLLKRAQNYPETVELLLTGETSLRDRLARDNVSTALVEEGNLDMMKKLLSLTTLKAEKKLIAEDLLSAFVFHATRNDQAVLSYLLSYKPNLDGDIFQSAVAYPKTAAIPTLLRHGANPFQEHQGKTPLSTAWQRKNWSFFFWMVLYSPFCFPPLYFLLLVLASVLVFSFGIRWFVRRLQTS